MKTLVVLLFTLLAVALAIVFFSNNGVVVVINNPFFTWPEVSLGTALIISFLSGLFFGFLYMLFPYASAKSSHYKLKREHRELEHELNSLRTASLDDLSQEAVDVGSVDANGEKIG
jgi:uncharacterized membrane protein YciS (DUF1049 family)